MGKWRGAKDERARERERGSKERGLKRTAAAEALENAEGEQHHGSTMKRV